LDILGFLSGIAGGVALVVGKLWGLYLVTASYLIVVVAVA
jgi:hypothetical protein